MSKNKLYEELLNCLSYLDAYSGSKGELIAKGVNMVNATDDQSIRACLNAIGNAKMLSKDNSETQIIIKSVYEALLPFLGRIKFKELIDSGEIEPVKEETFEELCHKLNTMIGLNSVKSIVNDLMAYHRVQKMRAQSGLKVPARTLHLAFLGNPGTGKTTVARIVGKMYKQLGLLSKGHFMEVSRTDLIAGYQGQTAIKVKQVIEKAKGGVLFIDEAYSLTENDHSDSYGRECLTELTKALEDYRNDLVVIVAGYTDLMKAFFESNPGLKSRFNTFIEFKDYNTEELKGIFRNMCEHDDYILTPDAMEKLVSLIQIQVSEQQEKFANGRYIRNLYEDVIMNHAKRINSLSELTIPELQCIVSQDIPEAYKRCAQERGAAGTFPLS